MERIQIASPKKHKVTLRPYQIADRGWVIASNARHYITCEGFSPDFRGVIMDAITKLELQIFSSRSKFVIAEVAGRPVGSIFFSPEGDSAGRIRLFFLEQAFRGQGIGKQMLTRVIEFARHSGFDRLFVSTFDRHLEACELYRSFGFSGVTGQPSLFFGRNMRQMDFELMLSDGSP